MLIAAARLCQKIRRDPDLNELGHCNIDAPPREKVAMRCQRKGVPRVEWDKRNVEDPLMNALIKILILGALGAALAGCVVAPVGRPVRAYVAVPAPVVVVRPYGYYGPR